MQLRPITDDVLDDAIAVLRRGFPERPAAFWRDGFARVCAFCGGGSRPPGYLMNVGGADVGVLLTFANTRTEPQPIVNLSSWYIDAKHRWLAPRMLQKLTGCSKTLYTDLTPTPQLRPIIERLGFRARSDGAIFHLLPWTWLTQPRNADVIALEAIRSSDIPETTLSMMQEHAELGCIAFALWDGTALHPLVFVPMRRRGIPFARLAYAQHKSAVANHLGPLARHLLARGLPLLMIDGFDSERPPHCAFTRKAPPIYVKGDMAPDAVDFTYSELVLLRL